MARHEPMLTGVPGFPAGERGFSGRGAALPLQRTGPVDTREESSDGCFTRHRGRRSQRRLRRLPRGQGPVVPGRARASSTRSSARTEPARPRPWRSSRGTDAPRRARCASSAQSPTDRRAVRPTDGHHAAGERVLRRPHRLGVGPADRPADAALATWSTGCSTSSTSPTRPSTQVSQLSGGEKRRLDFATAVYGRPELIFLDEPTTGLDIQSRDALWNAVEQLRDDGSTVVLTTHYLEEAQQRADRIGLMHEGTLRREGTVAELTRSLPAVDPLLAPPRRPDTAVRSAPVVRRLLLIETFELQADLKQLLDWADAHAVELLGLSAGADPARRRLPRHRPRSDRLPTPHHERNHHHARHRSQRTRPDPPQPLGAGHRPPHARWRPAPSSSIAATRSRSTAASGTSPRCSCSRSPRSVSTPRR